MATSATARHRTLRATLTCAACLSLTKPSRALPRTACRARRKPTKTRRPLGRSCPDRQPTAPRPWSRPPRRGRPAAPRSPSWARSWRGASPEEALSSCLTSAARRARRPLRLRAARLYQRTRRRLRSECSRSWQTLPARGQGARPGAAARRSQRALAPPSTTPGVPRAAVGRVAAQRKVRHMTRPKCVTRPLKCPCMAAPRSLNPGEHAPRLPFPSGKALQLLPMSCGDVEIRQEDQPEEV